MMSSEIPKNNKYVDEHVVRMVAAQAVVITALTLYISSAWPALFLAIDFFIRAFTVYPSPLAFVAKKIVHASGFKSKPIFAPPKKFAALLGFVFSVSITLLLLGYTYTAIVIGVVLIVCAVLESVFNICLGCYVFNWIVAPISRNFEKK